MGWYFISRAQIQLGRSREQICLPPVGQKLCALEEEMPPELAPFNPCLWVAAVVGDNPLKLPQEHV